MHLLAKLDHRYLWHPFTQMQDWLKREPILITKGQGAVLWDINGKEYLDANASIWTNLHGHSHPRINAAITRQLAKIAHSSALGLASEPASLLGAELVRLANARVATAPASPPRSAGKSNLHRPRLERVFYSDDGSTAVEVALKLAYEFARRTSRSRRPRFLSLAGAYHGDTIGAVSLGHIDLFHKAYSGLLFRSEKVRAPYCYRCRFNRAEPDRADARTYRQCNWECVDEVEARFRTQRKKGSPLAAFVVEPLMQGAAGMIPQPAGWLRRVAEITHADGAQLIADEVMTGFGRTGPVFACQAEAVQPDYLAVAKGLTGGYLPMAATLTTGPVFDAFLGEYSEFKTFFHGHSFTANQLGAAAALASLGLLQEEAATRRRQELADLLESALQELWLLPNVGDIRRVGLIAGIELVRDRSTRKPFKLAERVGIRVSESMARRGVITRPIGNVIVLMPPYCTRPAQLKRMVGVLGESVEEVCSESPGRS
jgi:adenosylmethionine-8-amino-7-oxononanoate aminotransferase